jgi:hypothetical protein
MEKAAAEFGVSAKRLMAIRRWCYRENMRGSDFSAHVTEAVKERHPVGARQQ